ncbi:hypothetical protein DSL64_09650 [Dyadobacter luteus]|uniref:Polysaccharide biosynthesis protein n=1 Tax=Dyadobacter luteus TaxID=2259619 RepID=A0A3D8YDF8_9BACT|nr:oligosaccharide flippase family protein [Dyadobacter luteus]REA62503.1 hypothetical protein DSL64_09650 [Dyadobacter luteus]
MRNSITRKTTLLKITNPFLKNVLTLVSGTALAQLITVGVYPICSRLYSPEDYGFIEVIVSVTAILTSVACLKYEQGIVLPAQDEEGFSLLKMSILINFFVSTLLLISICFFSGTFAIWLGRAELKNYLFAIPFLVFFSALFVTVRFYAIRKSEFKLIARVSVEKAIIGGITQIVFGLAKLGSLGLIITQLTSASLVNGSMYKRLTAGKGFWNFANWQQEKETYVVLAKKYIDFPKFSVAATLANSLALYSTSIFVFKYFDAAILGQYSFANRLLSMPLILISSAVSDAFIQRATEEKRLTGNAQGSFLQILKPLVLVSIPTCVVAYFVLPDLFSWILGNKWYDAGRYASILIFLFSVRFFCSPLSSALIVFEKQKWLLFATGIQMMLTLCTFYTTYRYTYSFESFLYVTVLSQSLFYLAYLYLIWNVVRGK